MVEGSFSLPAQVFFIGFLFSSQIKNPQIKKFTSHRVILAVNWSGIHMVDKYFKRITFLPIDTLENLDFMEQMVKFTATDQDTGKTHDFEFQTHNVITMRRSRSSVRSYTAGQSLPKSLLLIIVRNHRRSSQSWQAESWPSHQSLSSFGASSLGAVITAIIRSVIIRSSHHSHQSLSSFGAARSQSLSPFAVITAINHCRHSEHIPHRMRKKCGKRGQGPKMRKKCGKGLSFF
jgi:hypothetical protein